MRHNEARCGSNEALKIIATRAYGDAPPNTSIDLSFTAILRDLNIPPLAQHDAFNEALMTAMMYVALPDMKETGICIPRLRTHVVFDPTGT
jgi:DNA polymerase III subunit epsilon